MTVTLARDFTSRAGVMGNGTDRSEVGREQEPSSVEMLRAFGLFGYITTVAIDGGMDAGPAVDSLLSLRRDSDRRAALEDLIRCLRPVTPDAAAWEDWVTGGAALAAPSAPARPPMTDANSGRALERLGGRISRLREAVSAADQAVADAEAKRAAAAANLRASQATEAAVLHWVIAREILSLIQPILALGPAWTVLRAIAGQADPQGLVEPQEPSPEPMSSTRATGPMTTRSIMLALDFFGGDPSFETDLRDAIATVIERHEHRREHLERRGHRTRPWTKARTSIGRGAAANSDWILSVLKELGIPPEDVASDGSAEGEAA